MTASNETVMKLRTDDLEGSLEKEIEQLKQAIQSLKHQAGRDKITRLTQWYHEKRLEKLEELQEETEKKFARYKKV